MNDAEKKALCLSLLKSDSEEDVIKILTDTGFWADDAAWRLYGDRDGNFATIGNQQSRPESALVEKIINSVDARLMNACYQSGVIPASADAPPSIRAAVARFFEGRETDSDYGGTLQRWGSQERTKESKNITLAATGSKRNPCLTIADMGEGQTPFRMPDTFLSIDRDNKLRIPFVQGKFNMGGTGVLKFCGKHRFQMIITRRNPRILDIDGRTDNSDDHWGFTIVRREKPSGAVRNSVYTYLAPENAYSNPRKGGVLHFKSDTMPLMPELKSPYEREVEYGSAIKLFNYDMKGFSSHILLSNGLLYRLEVLLPEIALPVSVHECRDYAGKKGSFVTPLSGLTVRLEEGRGDNLEEGYPCSVPFSVSGEKMVAKIYAFKKAKAKLYRPTNEGIIFTVNGQTHGAIPKTIFQRNSVKLGRLADALLVTIDSSDISVDAREDLFMNSRDRLSNGELRKAVEGQLEDILHKHPGLRALRDERKKQEVNERLDDAKPLEDILESILKVSPSLSSLFLKGQRLSRPFKPGGDNEKEGEGNGKQAPFKGKKHPTYFNFRKKKAGELLERNCELGRKCRITFETDVENEYFDRADFEGRYDVEVLESDLHTSIPSHNLTLHDGFANWSIELPDSLVVGDSITLQCTVSDDVLDEPFVNIAKISMIPQSNKPSSKGGTRRSKSGGGKEGGTAQSPGLQMPEVIEVKEQDWQDHDFNELSACKVVQDAIGEGDDEQTQNVFYVNVDNKYLKNDMKRSSEDPSLMQAKFTWGNVLVGLALLQDHEERLKHTKSENGGAENGEDTPIVDKIRDTSKALAPFLVPMIDYLGGLSSEDVTTSGSIGDDE